MTDHADKYNDPRAKITGRGILMGVFVAVLGVAGAFGSIYLRRTQLEKTTNFFGPNTITALQLSDHLSMRPAAGAAWQPVELTATPGLGHLRKALLEETHYDWDSATDQSVSVAGGVPAEQCVRLRFEDPTGKRVPTIELDLDLSGGWIGPADGTKCVRVLPRVQGALKFQLELLRNVKQNSYDLRSDE